MNLVIPLRNGGGYEQLRFALRSITTHHNITDCILVGGKPSWYTGKHIPFKDYGPVHKEANIRDKTIAGAEYCAGSFLWANDDIILLKPYSGLHNKGLLSECLSKRIGNGSYTRCLRNTFEHYGDVPNVDTHAVMMMDVNGVKKTAFGWPDFGIGFKTCYSQENNLQSTFYPDLKIDNPIDLSNRDYFSLTDSFRNYKFLLNLYPNKCIFEL